MRLKYNYTIYIYSILKYMKFHLHYTFKYRCEVKSIKECFELVEIPSSRINFNICEEKSTIFTIL